jgi:type VI protein secretion system component Hcp
MTRRISLLAVVYALFMSTTARAQESKPPQSFITVIAEDLKCTTPLGSGIFGVDAWSFGAAIAKGTINTEGIGQANVSDLNIQKKFDDCTPALFGAVTTSKHFPSLTLVQQDKKETLMTVVLTDVVMSSYQIAGTQTTREPVEAIAISFAKICVSDVASGKNVCFDFKTQTSS